MQPSDFTKSATANDDGTYTYTCTKTVTGLRAGLDAVITEDENWSWRYDLTETSVDTTITAGTEIDTDVILTEPITLNADATLSESSVLASGSILAAGTTVSGAGTSGVTLVAGTKIATDVIIDSDVNVQSIDLDIYLSGDVTIADTATLKEGTILKAGTTFATGTVFYADSFDRNMTVDYVDGNGDTKTVNISNLITSDSYKTVQDITLSSDVTLYGDVKVSGGTVLKAGTLLKAGNMLPDGTKIPADSYLAYDTTIPVTVTLSVGVILVQNTTLYTNTILAKGTILTEGTMIPDDLDIEAYGTIDADTTDNIITVNYSHDLWTTGYENDDMGLDTNKNGFNDTIVDITGDGIPDIEAFVYRDRNNDGYTDIDYLAPYVTETQVTAGDYTNFDIAFDLDNDGFVDMLVSADEAGDDGRRYITASMTAHTADYFVGFYINEDGNIETKNGVLIFNRANKYFNGYYVNYDNYDPDNPSTAVIVGGNGGIYRLTDTEGVTDYSDSSKKTFYITKADGVDDDGDGSNDQGVGITNVLISSTDGGSFYGTGRVIVADPVNLELFNRDGVYTDEDGKGGSDELEALPLLIRDTYRYINSNEYLVFTGEYDRDGVEGGDPPVDGQIDTYFTNILANEKWLSFDDVIANEFSELTVISTGGGDND